MDDKRLSVAAVICDEEGQVLLVKQTYGHLNWEIPGGNVEPKEAIVDAVVREVREETGLDVVPDRATGIYDEQDMDFLHVVFACHLTELGAEARAADLIEVSACTYWSLDALPRPISDYTVRRITDAVKAGHGSLPLIVRERRWLE